MWTETKAWLLMILISGALVLVGAMLWKNIIDALTERRRRRAEEHWRWLESTGNGKDGIDAR